MVSHGHGLLDRSDEQRAYIVQLPQACMVHPERWREHFCGGAYPEGSPNALHLREASRGLEKL